MSENKSSGAMNNCNDCGQSIPGAWHFCRAWDSNAINAIGSPWERENDEPRCTGCDQPRSECGCDELADRARDDRHEERTWPQ